MVWILSTITISVSNKESTQGCIIKKVCGLNKRAHHSSNMFICSLDAEKCFDSIWHDGLFYKLIDIFDTVLWRFLYNWYSNLEAVIKWDGHFHRQYSFKVTRGTRQGSIISPILYNIFLSDLMKQLNKSEFGLCISNELYSSFAYANDITLFCAPFLDYRS